MGPPAVEPVLPVLPVLPDYGGACLDAVVPTLMARREAPWCPLGATRASQVVLLVLDGLGWDQLAARPSLAPTLSAMVGGPITSVVPTTTATALTSITTGLAPCQHGVMGYRLRLAGTGPQGGDEVLNVLRWRTAAGDARARVAPGRFQPRPAFGGQPVPVVTRAEFGGSGFSAAHLVGGRLVGWRMPSTLVAQVRRELAAGQPFVYAYYDGVDKVAHEFGLDDRYDAEVAAADRLVADLVSALPAGAALVVTSDHGQVDVGDAGVVLDPELAAATTMLSGEGRFRWLHAAGDVLELAAHARALYGDRAWVRTREEAVAEGWFGGALSSAGEERLGDVAVVPHAPIAMLDPADTGEVRMMSRHGSLTAAEMLVPLLVAEP